MARNAPYRKFPLSPAAGKPSRRALVYVMLWRPQEERANGEASNEPHLLTEGGDILTTESGDRLILE